MQVCRNCGAELNGRKFCGVCGKSAPAAKKPVQQDANALKAKTYPGGSCLFASLLSVGLLPYLLNAGLVMLTKNLLPAILPLATSLLGFVAGWTFLSCSVLRVQGSKLTPKGILSCGLNLFACGGGTVLCAMLVFSLFGDFTVYLYQNNLLHPIVMLILSILLPICSSALVAYLLLHIFGMQKRPAAFLKAAALILAARYAAPLIAALPLAFVPGLAQSLTSEIVRLMLTALLRWCALLPLLQALLPSGQKINPATPKRKRFAMITAGALAMFCIVPVVQMFPPSPKSAVLGQISDMVKEGDRFAAEGDLLSAAACYKHAIARRDAWRIVLSGEGNLWGAIHQTYNDEAVRLLQVEAQSSQNNDLYSWLLTKDCPRDYYAYYLDSIREKAQTDEYAASRQHEILLDCIQNSIWMGSYTTRSALSDKQAGELLDEIEAMSADIDSRLSVMVYSDLAANGGVLTLDIAKRAVALAEQYPTNLALQGSAMELGCSYTDDLHENCYEGATAAAKRFDALFEQQNPNSDPHDYEAEKVMVAYNLMKIQKIEEAQAILNEAVSKSESIALRYLLATCHYRAGDYEVCAKMAEAIYAEVPGHQQSLGLAMLARGLNGQLSEALNHALDLSEQAQSGNAVVGDSMLSTYARGMAGFYISRKQFPLRYGDLSEEDKARLERDPLLSSMVLSSWHWARRDYDEALRPAQQALEICPDWPSLYYIKGSILFEQKDYRAAADSYEQAVMINGQNPSAWFMLGQALDRLELYELSANAFQKVIEIVPNSDHEVDKYGLALHADWALSDLQDYVGGEGEKP